MAVYSPISKIELESFLGQYSIGSLIAFEGILEGIENTNYKIKTSNNMYILTIFEKRVNPDDLPFFINLKNHLSKKKFECPKPISNKEGKYINFINNKYCIITSFLEGQKTSSVQNNHCKQVGEMLALFHQKSKGFKETRSNTMNHKQWKNLFMKSKKIPNNKFNEIMPNIENELIYLKKIWPDNLPHGIIHADVFQDNVFFKENKISGLIDFYFSCNDFFAYDLALTINAWCFDDQVNFEEEKFLNLIQGYENLRKLETTEKKNFSTLLRGAAIRILLTRIHDLLYHPIGAYVEPKDPKEFIYILKFHQNNNLNDFLL